MSQKLSENDFKWVEDLSEFGESFIKCYNEESDEGYFLKMIFNILKNYVTFIMLYHFHLKD